MTLLEQFAAFAARLDPDRLPPEVVRKAKLCVLDTISACLTIGSTDGSTEALGMLRPEPSVGGSSRILGRTERTDPEAAAFINAVSAAATIRTDTHAATASHPGMAVIPAVLACGEAAHADGLAVLAGVVAGYEFTVRLGLAVITPQLASVFRPTGLLGPGGAALGVATATGLDEATTVRAVALACHTAAGFNEWVHAGTIEHIYHAGFAVRNAITAVRLARAGAQGAPSLLEGPSGLLAGFAALDRADLVTTGLGDRLLILDVVHKPAPACIFAQSPAQTALRLRQSQAIDPSAIEDVEIITSARAVGFPGCDNATSFTDPPGVQQSIQFSVAAVLAAGAVREELWACPADPGVMALAARCRLAVDPSDPGQRQPVRLRVRLADGRIVEESVADFVSMSEDEVVRRYLHVATPVLGADRAERALDRVMRLEEATDLNDVTALFAPA